MIKLFWLLGVDGKVIHLVKRPPPSLAQGTAATEGGDSVGTGAAATPGTGTGGGAEVGGRGVGGGITIQASQDLVFVGNIPVSSHSDITQVTQVIPKLHSP